VNRLISAIRAHGHQAAPRIAVDPICDFPVDYYLLSEMIDELAFDLAVKHNRAQPVAVRLNQGLKLTLLDLALLEAGIPQLALPRFLPTLQVNHALSANFAQALYDDDTEPQILATTRNVDDVPAGTARITLGPMVNGAAKGGYLSAESTIAAAELIAAASQNEPAGRHLALMRQGSVREAVAGLYAPLLRGCTVVCPPTKLTGLVNPFRPDFEVMARRIAEWRITSLSIIPEYLEGLISTLEANDQRLPLLRLITVDGLRASGTLATRARALGLPLREIAADLDQDRPVMGR
jgi:hypothetical protein